MFECEEFNLVLNIYSSYVIPEGVETGSAVQDLLYIDAAAELLAELEELLPFLHFLLD